MQYIKYIGMMIIGVFLIGVIAFAILIIVLEINKYEPPAQESITIEDNQNLTYVAIKQSQTISLISYNMGYAGLGAQEDFFMDDGSKSRPDNQDIVMAYYHLIEDTLKQSDADIMIVQEIDRNSKRSYYFDEYEALKSTFDTYQSVYADNYNVRYVPVPFPPMGKVKAGQGTFSKYKIDEATRIALPSQYPWPKSLVMLDRCLVKTVFEIEGSQNKLIIYNAHFSAYDDGTLREAQMALAKETILEAYANGNYIILGGDFNQTFPGIDTSEFPLYQSGKFYMPYQIEDSWTPEGWQWGIDRETPTYRLNNTEYIKGVTQVGIIDGYLVSPNIEIENVTTDDLDFAGSDHNLVKMTFKLLAN